MRRRDVQDAFRQNRYRHFLINHEDEDVNIVNEYEAKQTPLIELSQTKSRALLRRTHTRRPIITSSFSTGHVF